MLIPNGSQTNLAVFPSGTTRNLLSPPLQENTFNSFVCTSRFLNVSLTFLPPPRFSCPESSEIEFILLSLGTLGKLLLSHPVFLVSLSKGQYGSLLAKSEI